MGSRWTCVDAGEIEYAVIPIRQDGLGISDGACCIRNGAGRINGDDPKQDA